MEINDITKAFIDKYYDGNTEEYLAGLSSTSQEKKHIADSLLETLSWRDIDSSFNCYPQYELKALLYIESHLGYLPKPITYMSHEAFVRSVIATYESGNSTEEQFLEELDFHCKRIRNDDMKKSETITNDPYIEKDITLYNSHLSLYKQAAKDRLASFLGVEPLLEYSLYAEIFLRQLFQMDVFYVDMPFCEIDYRAATIYKYREAILLGGEENADASPLINLIYDHERITLK